MFGRLEVMQHRKQLNGNLDVMSTVRRIAVRMHVLGVRTVPVPHGLDGSVLRVPCPCRSEFVSTAWTDGGQDGLGPSKSVIVHPSWPSDGFGRVSPKFHRAENLQRSLINLIIAHRSPSRPSSLSLPGRRYAIHFKKMNGLPTCHHDSLF